MIPGLEMSLGSSSVKNNKKDQEERQDEKKKKQNEGVKELEEKINNVEAEIETLTEQSAKLKIDLTQSRKAREKAIMENDHPQYRSDCHQAKTQHSPVVSSVRCV